MIFVAALVVFLLAAAALYRLGMGALEHKPRTFLESLEWATETLSTTGFGYDDHWTHPAMIALVIAVQIAGVTLLPLILFGVILPYLSERFEQRVPREADRRLVNHVIVYRFGPAVETLVQRLAAADIDTLVVDIDEAAARAVMDRGVAVVFSRTEEDMLDVCRASAARAIVANGRDEENAALILRARQSGFTREIYTFVESPVHRKTMELAGATAAYTPRHIVAAALAAHASDTISPRVPGLDAIEGLQRREIRVPPTSPLAGKTLAESRLGADSGAVVLGVWCRSRLLSHCKADTRIEPGCVLELAGDAESLARAAALIGAPFLRNSGPFLIAGFGEVGRKVHELLTDVGEAVRVVDRRPGEGIVGGDVLDVSVLERAGLAEARAVILALDSDDSTLFATVIVRDAVPDVTLIARVNHARNVENIHRAGADYALSIAEVSGEMLSSRLLGRSARMRDEHRRAFRVPGVAYAGRRVAQLPLRSRDGASLLAVERNGETIRRITPELRIEAGDALWICSTSSHSAA
jgi:Trk K+ transport system NAD-binding subunit